MNDSNNEKITQKEEFDISYRVFVNALEIMTKDAKSQCEIMGNYNVAWELKDDVSAGEYLINMPGGSLGEKQQHGITELLHELKKIPDDILKEAVTAEDNLEAMNHPCWKGIREYSKNLLRIFK